jgi:hypothetical protein
MPRSITLIPAHRDNKGVNAAVIKQEQRRAFIENNPLHLTVGTHTHENHK